MELTPEQEETSIHGLRILARLIARRHLALMRAESNEANAPGVDDATTGEGEEYSLSGPLQSKRPTEDTDD